MEQVEPQTWHHGLVARWWSLFRDSGPEIAYFRQFVEAGQPALDVACGTGRLLVPYLQAGLDVDGCDVSPDMVALCALAVEAVGASAQLTCQAMHALDLPRRYRTILVCGGFGLGSTRDQDQLALRRLYEHLEPGGRLVLDNEVPYADAAVWDLWPSGRRGGLPEQPRPPGARQLGPDGDEYALESRLLAVDPLGQQVAREIRASRWRAGSLVAEEHHRLTSNLYFRSELVLMLERAGFAEVAVRGEYNDLPPTPDDAFLVYVATREPGTS
ncbi:MAG: class I SAM-dependent methyltransferase [Candidatus Nanopelagicales bacterium]|nr:class I SAM-dependent methyltransferase [Candidatus Nanopelagicales bacterium]